jgi:deoxyhypusine synthase
VFCKYLNTTKLRRPISQFIEKHYLHFNSASLVDAAKAYEDQLANGAKMMVVWLVL